MEKGSLEQMPRYPCVCARVCARVRAILCMRARARSVRVLIPRPHASVCVCVCVRSYVRVHASY